MLKEVDGKDRYYCRYRYKYNVERVVRLIRRLWEETAFIDSDGLEHGNQFHGLGPDILLRPVGNQLMIQPRFPIERLGQLQYHRAKITAGIQVGFGVAPGHILSSQINLGNISSFLPQPTDTDHKRQSRGSDHP